MKPTIDTPAKAQGTCKAVVVHGAGRASMDDIPIPEIGPDEVLIQVAYVGVCVTDLEIVSGTLGYYKDHIAEYPIVPGHEVSGAVVATGDLVTNVTAGDRVVIECIQGCGSCPACRRSSAIGCERRAEFGVIRTNGGYAEFVSARGRFVHRVPPSLDLREACLCEPLAVVLKGLARLARVWADDARAKSCAVLGAGPLGRLCAMVLAHRGHAVTIFDQDARRLANVAPIVASPTLDGLCEFDAVIEATGQQPVLEFALKDSRAGAAILLLGLPYSESSFAFERIVADDKIVIGSVGSGPDEFTAALALLPLLDPSPFMNAVLPLKSFEQAWEFARTRTHLKVMLTPGECVIE